MSMLRRNVQPIQENLGITGLQQTSSVEDCPDKLYGQNWLLIVSPKHQGQRIKDGEGDLVNDDTADGSDGLLPGLGLNCACFFVSS